MALALRRKEAVAEDPALVAAARAAHAEFLDGLRRRAAWPSEAAARLRAGVELELPAAPPAAVAPLVLAPLEPQETASLAEVPLAVEPERPVTPAEHVEVAAARRWSIWTLERLVREHGYDESSDVESWSYYLVYLRHHADASGLVPAEFTALIESVFASALNPAQQ